MGSGPGGEGETRMRPRRFCGALGVVRDSRAMRAATLPPMEWPAMSQGMSVWGCRARMVSVTAAVISARV